MSAEGQFSVSVDIKSRRYVNGIGRSRVLRPQNRGGLQNGVGEADHFDGWTFEEAIVSGQAARDCSS